MPWTLKSSLWPPHSVLLILDSTTVTKSSKSSEEQQIAGLRLLVILKSWLQRAIFHGKHLFFGCRATTPAIWLLLYSCRSTPPALRLLF